MALHRTPLRRPLGVAGVVTLLLTGCSVEAGPDQLAWQPSWPRTQMVVVRGSPASRGPYAFRFRMPDGYWTHPHTHPTDARIRVVSGSYLFGKGTVLDPSAAKTLPPGSVIELAAGTIHFDGALGETVIEVSGIGPWGITFLDPSKDPAATTADRAAVTPR